MDSASPVAKRAAGQPTVDSGVLTVAKGTHEFSNAEFAFAFDWLSGRFARGAGCRGAHHRPATGEAAA